ncbi:MAG: hypothetical protein HY290_02370 [Planctomycetia bacterium]|nr:hypothetical protein [Planctomycetia bacterium]
MSHFAPAIVLFEKAPRWEAELKRRFEAHQVLVRPCRSPVDVLGLCRRAPGSVVVVDFAVGIADTLRLLGALVAERLETYPIVIGSIETAELEWSARELGAVDFVTDRIGGGLLASLCRRALDPVLSTQY